MKEYSKAIKFFWNYFKKFKVSFFIITLTIIIATYLQVKVPVFIGDALTQLGEWVTAYFKHQGAENEIEKVRPDLKLSTFLDTPCPTGDYGHGHTIIH